MWLLHILTCWNNALALMGWYRRRCPRETVRIKIYYTCFWNNFFPVMHKRIVRNLIVDYSLFLSEIEEQGVINIRFPYEEQSVFNCEFLQWEKQIIINCGLPTMERAARLICLFHSFRNTSPIKFTGTNMIVG